MQKPAQKPTRVPVLFPLSPHHPHSGMTGTRHCGTFREDRKDDLGAPGVNDLHFVGFGVPIPYAVDLDELPGGWVYFQRHAASLLEANRKDGRPTVSAPPPVNADTVIHRLPFGGEF